MGEGEKQNTENLSVIKEVIENLWRISLVVQGFTAGGLGLYIPGLGTKILQVADKVKKKKKKEVVLSLKIFPNQIPLPHTHTHKLFGHGKSQLHYDVGSNFLTRDQT